MRPEQLTPTLETCQRLKAAGFPQDGTCFVHFYEQYVFQRETVEDRSEERLIDCAAPTLQELLSALPATDQGEDRLIVCKHEGQYGAGYGWHPIHYHDSNAAEAAAQLWLTLNEVPA